MKYNIYIAGSHGGLVYSNCTLIANIFPGQILTDDEVRKYFKIDEHHKDWKKAHLPEPRFCRYVFDKCIVPNSPKFRIEAVQDD